MSEIELYTASIGRMANIEIHPVHKAIMEECCVRAIACKPLVTDLETLAQAVQTAFLVTNSTLRATLIGSLREAKADQVTFHIGDQEFVLAADDPFFS